jgi:mono/diheme cytochrome c family protein
LEVLPWPDRKSRRGRPKVIDTAGHACLNPLCAYFAIADPAIHALVSNGCRGKQRIRLERTTHIFEKLDNGGLQQVISDDGEVEQIELIRMHLTTEAERFSQGDFHDPAMIHGEDMAGLHELTMGADKLSIVSAEDGELVTALHAWFDQQLADHGEHAQAMRPESVEAAPSEPEPQMGMGKGMMGNNSMRIAHHAAIPEVYAGLSNPTAADAELLERGVAIYASSCAVCHGDGGMGDGPGAVNLDPPVSAIAHTSQMLSDAYLFWRTSEGGQGNPLYSTMPTWKETLD